MVSSLKNLLIRRFLNSSEIPKIQRSAWCLSTGRVGSQTIAALGALSEGITSRHEPEPKLYGLGGMTYSTGGEKGLSKGELAIAKEAVLAARPFHYEESGSVYLESSPQVTFLAPVLESAFSKSSFIHLFRHPNDVIRSGMRRNWYAGHQYDQWRISPSGSLGQGEWERYSQFEKIAWLWAETNRWIIDFMDQLESGRGLSLKSEDVFNNEGDSLARFYAFLEADLPSERELEKVLGSKLNQQKSGDFAQPDEWNPHQKEIVEKHCGALMSTLGYE